jgi:uncharacterized protein YbaA (DUF1428 family)
MGGWGSEDIAEGGTLCKSSSPTIPPTLSFQKNLPTARKFSTSSQPQAAVKMPRVFEGATMPYVDGYVVSVPVKKLKLYRKMAALGKKMWMEHGALEYCECVGEDLKTAYGTPFPKQLKLKAGETVVFAWIVFKSKTHRNKVNAAVMKDPRMKPPKPDAMPFDMTRMSYGGFKILVSSRRPGGGIILSAE